MFREIKILLFQLCIPTEVGTNVKQILQLLISYLCQEYIEYAVELAKNGGEICLSFSPHIFKTAIPISEPRTEPSTHFLEVVRQSVGMCDLFEKQCDQCVAPLVAK
jgi:hypothetical protein